MENVCLDASKKSMYLEQQFFFFHVYDCITFLMNPYLVHRTINIITILILPTLISFS